MFLAKLNEKEKVSFLALAENLIKADGVVLDIETSYLNMYANEMGISLASLLGSEDIEQIITNLQTTATNTEKKIILLELLALANADGEFAEEENVLIRKVVKTFNISATTLSKATELLDQFTTVYSSLNHFIEEK